MIYGLQSAQALKLADNGLMVVILHRSIKSKFTENQNFNGGISYLEKTNNKGDA